MTFATRPRSRAALLIAATGYALFVVPVNAPARAEIVFAVDSNVDSLYTLDLVTGAATLIGPLHPDPMRFTTPVAMAARPNDGEIFVWNTSPAGDAGLSTVDRASGLATLVGGGAGAGQALAFDGNIKLHAIVGGALVTISQTTGAVISSVGAGLPSDNGFDFNPADGLLYAISGPASAAELSQIDPATGALLSTVALTTSLTGSAPGTLLFDSSGTLHGTTNGSTNNLFEIDPATGNVSNFRTVTGGFVPQGMGLIPKSACKADLDRDGNVGIVDFLELLANWGPCP